MIAIVIVSGSHGTLSVDRDTGIIMDRVEGCDCGDCHDGYGDIGWFDPVPFARERERDRFDVLATGYYLHDGSCVPPLTMRCAINLRDGEVFDEWVDMALLPAPSAS